MTLINLKTTTLGSVIINHKTFRVLNTKLTKVLIYLYMYLSIFISI